MKSAERDLRRWADQARNATRLRDEAIRAMRAEGATLRAIGAVAGLTHAGVARILEKG